MSLDEAEQFEIVIEYQFEDTLGPDWSVGNWFTPFYDWCRSEEANGSPLCRSRDKIWSAEEAIGRARVEWTPAPPEWHVSRNMFAYTRLSAEELDTLRCMLLFTETSRREKARRGDRRYVRSNVMDSLMRQIKRALPGCETDDRDELTLACRSLDSASILSPACPTFTEGHTMTTDKAERFEIAIQYHIEDPADPDCSIKHWFSLFYNWCRSNESRGSKLWRTADQIGSADSAMRKTRSRPPEGPVPQNVSWSGWLAHYTQLTAEEVDTLRCVLLFMEASQPDQREKARRPGPAEVSIRKRDSLMSQVQRILPGCETYP